MTYPPEAALRFLGKAAPASIAASDIETVPAPPDLREVTISGAELQAICPVTGQPDLYRVTIRYLPNGRLLESKALKLYLVSWRDRGIMCEALSAAIAADLAPHLGTQVEVELVQQARGGLSITARSVSSRPGRHRPAASTPVPLDHDD